MINSMYPRRVRLSFIITAAVTLPLFAQDIPSAKRELPPLFEAKDLQPEGPFFWMAAHALEATEAEGIESIAYAPDGSALLTGDTGDHSGSKIEAGNVNLWDLKTLRRRWSVKPFEASLYGGNYPSIDELQISPNGRFASVIASTDRPKSPHALKILSMDNGRTIHSVSIPSFYEPCRGSVHGERMHLDPVSARFTPDSRGLIALFRNQRGTNYGRCSVVEDRWLIYIELKNGGEVWKYNVRLPPMPAHGVRENSCLLPVQTFEVSPDGNSVVIGDCVGTLWSVNARNGNENFRTAPYFKTRRAEDFPGSTDIFYVQFDPRDANRVYAVVGESGSKTMVAVADLNRREFLPKLATGVTDSQARLRFSPDGRLLALGGNNLYLWDRNSGRVLYMTYEGTGYAYFFQVNPRFQEIASVVQNHVVFLQPRPKRKDVRVGSAWTDAKIKVLPYTAAHIKARGGEVYVSWGYRGIDAYDYENVNYHGFQDDYFIKDGGRLDLRAEGDGVMAEIYGGLAPNESITTLRRSLKPWGEYWNNMGAAVHVADPDPVVHDSDDSDAVAEVDPDDAEEELIYAINTERPALLRGALKAGADPNLRNSIGHPVIMMAALSGKVELVRILIKAGADVNAKTSIGSTALSQAAWNGYDDIIIVLVEAGANLDASSNKGVTALMLAARSCRVDTVGVLVDAGADQTLKDEDGDTAFDYAKSNCNYATTVSRMINRGLKPR